MTEQILGFEMLPSSDDIDGQLISKRASNGTSVNSIDTGTEENENQDNTVSIGNAALSQVPSLTLILLGVGLLLATLLAQMERQLRLTSSEIVLIKNDNEYLRSREHNTEPIELLPKETIKILPKGTQTELTSRDLAALGGCWKLCYNQKIGSYSTGSDITANCTGDRIFLTMVTKSRPDKFLVGAFASKDVFERGYNEQPPKDSRGYIYIDPYFFNGVFWYKFHSKYLDGQIDRNKETDCYTYGFTTNPVPILSSYLSLIDKSGSSVGLSWDYRFGSINGVLLYDSRYSKLIYSNQCDLNVLTFDEEDK